MKDRWRFDGGSYMSCKIMRLLGLHIIQFACICCLFPLPESAVAQLGVKLGTTASNFYYTEKGNNPDIGYEIDLRPYLGYDVGWVQLGDQKAVVAPFVGLYYQLRLNNRFVIRPEVSFTQKGVSFSQFDYERVIYQVKISYLEIPLSVACQFIKKEKFVSELYAGGFWAFRLNALKRVAVHRAPVAKTKLTNVSSFDVGIHFGLAFKYTLFGNFMVMDLRLFQGLHDIFTAPEDQPELYHRTQKTKITGFNITVGYEF